MNSFYDSREWKRVRYQAIVQYGRKCMCCLADDKKIHVDHIKPISKFPELKLDISNLQILCEDCNIGKSNTDFTDFRDRNIAIKIELNPPGIAGYVKTKCGTVHVWSGSDTYCLNWSKSLIKKQGFEFLKKHSGKICIYCKRVKQLKYEQYLKNKKLTGKLTKLRR